MNLTEIKKNNPDFNFYTDNQYLPDVQLWKGDTLKVFAKYSYATFTKKMTVKNVTTGASVDVPNTSNFQTAIEFKNPYETNDILEFTFDYYIGHKITESDIVSFGNAVLYIDDNIAKVGDIFRFDKNVLKFIAKDGYKFFKSPTTIVSSVSFMAMDKRPIYFSVHDDFKTATFNDKLEYKSNGLDLRKLAFTVQTELDEVKQVKGLNDVFLISYDVAKNLMTQQYVDINNDGSTIDYRKNILGLLKLPFTIDSSLQAENSRNIFLGSKDTGLAGIALKNDMLHLDMGKITVTLPNADLTDYKNTLALLYLPYVNAVSIDTSYVINETLSFEYVLNLYNGDCTINITSSKGKGVILSRTVNLGLSVPFGADIESYPSKNNPQNIEIGEYNGINTPYIELLKNPMILKDGVFTIPVIDEGILQNQKGFIQVDEIELLSKTMNKRDIDNVKTLLKSGVIIK